MAERVPYILRNDGERERLSINLKALLKAAEERHMRANSDVKEFKLGGWCRKALDKIGLTPVAGLPLTAMLLVSSHAQALKMALPTIVGLLAAGIVGDKLYTRLSELGSRRKVSVPTALFFAVATFYAAGLATAAGYSFAEWLAGVQPPSRPILPPHPLDMGPPVPKTLPVESSPDIVAQPETPQTNLDSSGAPATVDEKSGVVSQEVVVNQPMQVEPTVLKGDESVWSTFRDKMRAWFSVAKVDFNPRLEGSVIQAFHDVAGESQYQNVLLDRTGRAIPWETINSPVYFDRLLEDPGFRERMSKIIVTKYTTLANEIAPGVSPAKRLEEVQKFVQLVSDGFTKRL